MHISRPLTCPLNLFAVLSAHFNQPGLRVGHAFTVLREESSNLTRESKWTQRGGGVGARWHSAVIGGARWPPPRTGVSTRTPHSLVDAWSRRRPHKVTSNCENLQLSLSCQQANLWTRGVYFFHVGSKQEAPSTESGAARDSLTVLIAPISSIRSTALNLL